MPPLRDRLKSLRQRLEPLKERLRHQEVEEERGGARGWNPSAQVTGLKGAPRRGAGRDRSTGGPLVDVAFPEAEHLQVLTPPAAALEAYESGEVWDITEACRRLLEGGGPDLLITFTLGHCHWSDRAQIALDKAHESWSAGAVGIVARGGDRLAKVYFRDIQLGDLKLTLPTFPITIHIKAEGEGYGLAALSMEPLGPDPDHGGVKRLLGGAPRIPSGSDHMTVGACRGSFCIPLTAENGFTLPGTFSLG